MKIHGAKGTARHPHGKMKWSSRSSHRHGARVLELSKVKGDWPSQFLVTSVTVVTIFRKTLTNSLPRALIGVKYRTALAQFLPVTVRSKVSRFHAPCTVTGIVPPSLARIPSSDCLRRRIV